MSNHANQANIKETSQTGKGMEEVTKRVFKKGVREYLDKKLPKATIKDKSVETMEKWEKYLAERGLEWTPAIKQYVENAAGFADVIAQAMDVPLRKVPFLPENTPQRVMAAIAERGPLLDPIDRFLFTHYPWIIGTQPKK